MDNQQTKTPPTTDTVKPKLQESQIHSSSLITDTATSPKGKLIIGSVVGILILGMVIYIFSGNKHVPATQSLTQAIPSTQTQAVTVAPTASSPKAQPTIIISPVTTANADQTLNTTDSTMQQSINQANTDLNDLNSIDSTQDTTNGL